MSEADYMDVGESADVGDTTSIKFAKKEKKQKKEKKKKKKKKKEAHHRNEEEQDNVEPEPLIPDVTAQDDAKRETVKVKTHYKNTSSSNSLRKMESSYVPDEKEKSEGVAIVKLQVLDYYKVYSDDDSKKFKHAEFILELENEDGHTWKVRKRYSELHRFHKRLLSRESAATKKDCDWLGFPEKKFGFFTDHSSVKFLDERMTNLNVWIKQVFRSPKIQKPKFKIIVDSFFLPAKRFSLLYPHVHEDQLKAFRGDYVAGDEDEQRLSSLERGMEAVLV